MRDWTRSERDAMTTGAAKAASAFLKGVADPERDLAVVAGRTAVERLVSELQAAHDAVAEADRLLAEAQARLPKVLASGQNTGKTWAAITEGERNAADARLRLALTEKAAEQAKALLSAARLSAIEAVLRPAGEAVRVAREAERAAELEYLAAQRALGLTRSRAGSLANQADHLRSVAVGGAE